MKNISKSLDSINSNSYTFTMDTNTTTQVLIRSVPKDLKKKFKVYCSIHDITMTDAILLFMRKVEASAGTALGVIFSEMKDMEITGKDFEDDIFFKNSESEPGVTG